MRCPCRKKSEATTYQACCEPLHKGAIAPTAEVLMRSRYAAFALGNRDYILATWHPSSRPKQIAFTKGEQWLMLKVLVANEEAARATVEFQARWRVGGTSRILHEVSRFVREQERWYYVDGTVQPTT